jgi:hypothetical protein
MHERDAVAVVHAGSGTCHNRAAVSALPALARNLHGHVT